MGGSPFYKVISQNIFNFTKDGFPIRVFFCGNFIVAVSGQWICAAQKLIDVSSIGLEWTLFGSPLSRTRGLLGVFLRTQSCYCGNLRFPALLTTACASLITLDSVISARNNQHNCLLHSLVFQTQL